jgi:hypothetical protein
MNHVAFRPGQNPFAKKKIVRPAAPKQVVVPPVRRAEPPPAPAVVPRKTPQTAELAPPSYRMEKKMDEGRVKSSLVLDDNNRPAGDGKRFRLCRLENGKYALREMGDVVLDDENHFSPLKKDDVSESIPVPVLVKKQKQEPIEPRDICGRVVIPLSLKSSRTDFVIGGGLFHPLRDTTVTKTVEIAPFLPSAALVERLVLTVITPDLDAGVDIEFTLAYLEPNDPGLKKILTVPLGAFSAHTAKIFSKNPEKEESTPKTGSFLVGVLSVRPKSPIRRGSVIVDYTVGLQQKKYRREQVIEIRNTQEKLSL